MPEFYTIIARKIFSRFFLGGGEEGAHAPLPPLTPPFLRLWVVIGPHGNGFPGPAVALDGPEFSYHISHIKLLMHKFLNICTADAMKFFFGQIYLDFVFTV